MDRDGKTWFWCPHYKIEGQSDGLYVTHKPEDHDPWLKRKNERLEKRRRAKDNNNGSEEAKQPDHDGTKKLVISDSLKATLMTHMDISPEQIDALVQEDVRGSDFYCARNRELKMGMEDGGTIWYFQFFYCS